MRDGDSAEAYLYGVMETKGAGLEEYSSRLLGGLSGYREGMHGCRELSNAKEEDLFTPSGSSIGANTS